MTDQEFLLESDERSSIEGFLNRRLSDLHLDSMSMASSTDAVCDCAAGADDIESYQVDFADPSPPRPAHGHNAHLKRRSPSSTYSPPQQPAGADSGFHRLISEGYQFLDVSGGDSGQKDSSCLRGYFSLDYTGRKPMPAAPAPNRGVPPENRTRRSLFRPPLPLGRTASDPVRLCSLVNHVLPARETTPIPKIDQKLPTAAHLLPPPRPLGRTASDPARLTSLILPKSPYQGLDSIQESPSCKRLKMVDSAKKIRQQMDKIKDWIDQMVEEVNAVKDSPINPETEIPAEKTINNTNEAPLQEEVLDKKMEEEDDLEDEADVVKARKVGECTLLEFKCRCGSGYSVVICGNSCFYKLL